MPDRAYLGCPLWKQRHESGSFQLSALARSPVLLYCRSHAAQGCGG
jgi:hypothetical protein